MRTSFSKLSLLALPLAALTACQDYEPFDEAEVAAAANQRIYEEAFVKAFGEINENHNWGFEPQIIGGASSSETRGSNTNSNEWITVYNYEVPGGLSTPTEGVNAPWKWAKGDVTNYERAYVYWWFSTHRWPKSEIINWSDYFIENVWGQPEHTATLADGNTSPGTQFGMDYLRVIQPGYSPAFVASNYNNSNAMDHPVTNTSTYEEVNDFNKAGDNLEQVMYQFNSTTLDFTYGASQVSSQAHNNWTIQYINGNYYLAFDYWHDKGNHDNNAFVEADGYYNDWILKLSNGKHNTTTGQTRRVMCEDLGNTFDWDYNDVVFDVTAFKEGENYYAQITLQAAGGTLPIYVGDMDHEAHAMFGVPTTQPVNVDNSCKRPAVVYRIEIDPSFCEEKTVNGMTVLTFNALNVPVYVTNNGDVPATNHPNGNLGAEPGKAPHKFSCPNDTYWMQELKDIRDPKGHPGIKNWFQGKDINGTELAANEIGSYSDWRTTEVNSNSWLYSDNGKPYATSYMPGEDPNHSWQHEEFIPWKQLWNALFDGTGNYKGDSQYTESRYDVLSYQNGKWSERTYTFMEQAPFIYETEGKDDDPVAFSSRIIEDALTYISSNSTSLEIVWPANYSTTATFSLSVSSEDNNKGTVSVDGATSNLPWGQPKKITANPNNGYMFDHWSTGWTNSTIEFNMYNNENIVAYFTQAFKVKLKSGNNGYFLVNGEEVHPDVQNGTDYSFAWDSNVTVEAKPNPYCKFMGWENRSETATTITLTNSNNNQNYTARFDIDTDLFNAPVTISDGITTDYTINGVTAGKTYLLSIRMIDSAGDNITINNNGIYYTSSWMNSGETYNFVIDANGPIQIIQQNSSNQAIYQIQYSELK